MHLGILSAIIENKVIDLDLQGHMAIIPIQETAFNVALVYWSRQAKGCYTSSVRPRMLALLKKVSPGTQICIPCNRAPTWNIRPKTQNLMIYA